MVSGLTAPTPISPQRAVVWDPGKLLELRKEAAARPVGQLRVMGLNAAMIRTTRVDGRMRADFFGLAAGVITAASKAETEGEF